MSFRKICLLSLLRVVEKKILPNGGSGGMGHYEKTS
jgi:hypothetical protein